jgi:hypothetical protein
MYYIISPKPICELFEYHIPFVEGTFTRNVGEFFSTAEGKEFLKLSPLKIYYTSNKKTAITEVATDIAFLGLCYDCPLYIAFLKNNTFHKMFDLGFYQYTNFEKCTKMQEHNKQAEIPLHKQYFKGNLDAIINECKKVMQFKLIGDNIANYYLNENKIIDLN